MNREILFKAKRKDNGEWVEGYYVYIDFFETHHIVKPEIKLEKYRDLYSQRMVEYEVNPSTICQCIGRTTEQGKAWEHDLIRLQSGEICEIVYDRNERAWCAASIKDTTKYILLKYALVTEYIGSKFDHLELIGGAS